MADLEHDLPGETFRVFPTSFNHRNTYDSPEGVRRAVAYRRGNAWDWDRVRVYRSVTTWEDVTHEYVKAAIPE